MTYLWGIREYTQQLLEAVAAAVKLEITVVDRDGRRVGGTGTYRSTIGSYLPKEYIFHQVVRTGETVVMTRPGESHHCLTCEAFQRNCPLVQYICSPIRVGGAIIGGIGFIADDQAQGALLVQNQKNLVEFVDRLGDLLAARMERDRSQLSLEVANEQLSTIMNLSDEAILAVDGTGCITHLNPAAEAVLGVANHTLIGQPLERHVKSEALWHVLRTQRNLSDVEMDFQVGNKEIRVLGSLRAITAGTNPAGAVCFFRDIERARKAAFQLTGRSVRITFKEIQGESPAVRDVVSLARKVAAGDATILLRGESGTGKELFARAIHHESPRRTGPFVAINCAAIPDALLESELFGYEAGSFTGAKREGNPGKLELAHGGTVFLDEIGDMPLALQAKLLRVLQERVVERVGGRRPVPINVRIVAATNRNLEHMVTEGQFREDLYYRLNVIPLIIPPLRQRGSDIELLLNRALVKCALALDKPIRGFAPEALQVLLSYRWPGNVRELENAVEYAANVESGSAITLQSLPQRIRQECQNRSEAAPPPIVRSPYSERPKRAGLARDKVFDLLDQHGWDTDGKRKVATALGISLATLYRRLKVMEVEPSHSH